MKINMTSKQIRSLMAQLYWTAHSDGRAKGNGQFTPLDFGNANITIESFSVKFGARPVRMKKAEK